MESWLYIGTEEYRGCIFLQHGCHYNVERLPNVKGGKKSAVRISVRDSGMATSMTYKNEKELEKFWLKPE